MIRVFFIGLVCFAVAEVYRTPVAMDCSDPLVQTSMDYEMAKTREAVSAEVDYQPALNSVERQQGGLALCAAQADWSELSEGTDSKSTELVSRYDEWLANREHSNDGPWWIHQGQ